jgi:lipoprotein-anchoring transpeptidase ErfK/SrfK
MKLLHLIPCFFIVATTLGGAFQAKAAPAVVISIADQELALIEDGTPVAQFPISTSKFGVGDRPGSYATPLGMLEVAHKIGANAPLGAVFKSRTPTGEILPPNARGRDPIVTRILWLRGLERQNACAYGRGIYIHGTPVERLIGRPASYGCIRMRSRDVANLFNAVSVGTRIAVVTGHLRSAIARASAGAWRAEFGYASN